MAGMKTARRRAAQLLRGLPALPLLAALGLGLALSLFAAPQARAEAKPIVVASKAFNESHLLAELMAQIIEEHTGLPVQRRFNLSGSLVTFEAILAGEIDLYPDYTGTAWYITLKLPGAPRSALECFGLSQSELRLRHDLRMLSPFGFNNTYALMTTVTQAQRYQLQRYSDLVRIQPGQLRLAFSHEFLNRSDGWPSLSKAYGLQHLTPRGVEHAIVYDALLADTIDLTDAFTTDGKLDHPEFLILEDDLGFFPPYHAVPILRGEVARRHPGVVEALGKLAFVIDEAQMQKLNRAAEDAAGDYGAVASRFLREQGLKKGGVAARGLGPPNALSGLDPGRLWGQLLHHIWMTSLAVLLAVLVGVPLGLWVYLYTPAAPWVFGSVGVLQTIPGLALLAVLVTLPGFGLGTTTAVTAIFLYAVLPIVRNTYTGLRETDPQLVDTALALGMSVPQRLLGLQLPLAAVTIMAGIRTSFVYSVGAATLAAFVGAGGLGEPILTGLQLTNRTLILSGAVPAALLALLLDFLLGTLERRLAPAGLLVDAGEVSETEE